VEEDLEGGKRRYEFCASKKVLKTGEVKPLGKLNYSSGEPDLGSRLKRH